MQTLKRFKETELGEIPEEWTVKRLFDVGKIVGGGTPDTNKKEYWEKGNISWAVPTDLTDLKTNYIDRTEKHITESGLNNSSAKLLPIGTVLITSRATIGECVITTIPITTNQGFQSIICNSENDNKFILYTIKFNKQELIRKSHGTTFLEISKSNINNLKIPIPSLEEQQKIASHLSKVDELREKTEQIVEQTQTLKEGLMQRLLTKGIGHTTFQEIYLQFKFQKFFVPKEWEIKKLSELVNLQTGYPFQSKNFSKEGIRLLKGSNVLVQRIDWKDIDYYPVNESKNYSEYLLEVGDIVIAMDRPFVSEGFKISRISTKDLPCLLVQRIGRFLKNKNINYDYLYYFLQSKIYKQSLSLLQKGMDLPHISKSEILSPFIILPSLEEQYNIVNILKNVDMKIKLQEIFKIELNNIKKSLMQQLLTGKIRVKV